HSFLYNAPTTTHTSTLSLHDALPLLQIAKLYGVETTGVDSTAKLEMMRSMGFDHVIDYTKEDFTKNGKCYDLILDVKTNRSMFRSEEHTSELQSRVDLVCRLLLEKKK